MTVNPATQKIIDLAGTQVGYHEGRNASGWDNVQKYSEEVPGLTWSDGQPWCATFMSWLALRSGNAALYPCTASVQTAYDWFKSRGQLSTTPQVGDQFILNVSEHTGLVIAVGPTTIRTREGNTNDTGSPQGDGVYELTRLRSDKRLTYGHPKFPAAPKEPVVPTSTPHIDNAIAELTIAINARKPGPVRYALRTSRRAAIVARKLAKGA